MKKLLVLHSGKCIQAQFSELTGKGVDIELLQTVEAQTVAQVSQVQRYTPEESLFIFSSAHAVDAVAPYLSLHGAMCAAVGKRTRARLYELGVEKCFTGPETTARSLAQSLLDEHREQWRGRQAVFVRGEVVRGGLSQVWQEQQESLAEIVSYRISPRQFGIVERAVVERFVATPERYICVSSTQVFAAWKQWLTQIDLAKQESLPQQDSLASTAIIAFSESIAEFILGQGYQVAYTAKASSYKEFVAQAICYLQSFDTA